MLKFVERVRFIFETLGRWDVGTLGRWDVGTLGRWDVGNLRLSYLDYYEYDNKKMKENWKLLVLLLLTITLAWVNYIPASIITGKYVNNNTEPTLEGPSSIHNGKDTLHLFVDNTFQSQTWGGGTYKIELGFWEKRIDLSYRRSGYSAHITKSFWGNPRIWLSKDLGFYFEKVD